MFILLPCLIIAPPPPPPLRAAVRSLVLVLHGVRTSTPSHSRGDVWSVEEEVEREGAGAGEGHKRGWGRARRWEDDVLLIY